MNNERFLQECLKIISDLSRRARVKPAFKQTARHNQPSAQVGFFNPADLVVPAFNSPDLAVPAIYQGPVDEPFLNVKELKILLRNFDLIHNSEGSGYDWKSEVINNYFYTSDLFVKSSIVLPKFGKFYILVESSFQYC